MNTKHKDRIVGLLDMVDITAFIVHHWDKAAMGEKFNQVVESSLRHKTAKDMMNYSRQNNCVTLRENATFKDVLKVLSKEKVRHIPILAKGSIFELESKLSLCRFLTKIDVLQFVATHWEDFGSSLDVTITGRLGTYPVNCVDMNCLTIDAFRKMTELEISAVGVKDERGLLKGNLSAREIGTVLHSTPTFDLTTCTVGEFLKLEQLPANRPKGPITCCLGEKVHRVITTMNKHRIHRVYVVDNYESPIGVISLSDICKFLLTITSEKLVMIDRERTKY